MAVWLNETPGVKWNNNKKDKNHDNSTKAHIIIYNIYNVCRGEHDTNENQVDSTPYFTTRNNMLEYTMVLKEYRFIHSYAYGSLNWVQI